MIERFFVILHLMDEHEIQDDSLQEKLATDLEKVKSIESDANLRYRKLIIRRRATPDEVEYWFSHQDPLLETMNPLGLGIPAVAQTRLGQFIEWYNATEMGGSNLVAAGVFPEFFSDEEQSRNWVSALNPLFENYARRHRIPLVRAANNVSTDEIVSVALDALADEKELDIAQMERLYTGSEMLEASVVSGSEMVRAMGREAPHLIETIEKLKLGVMGTGIVWQQLATRIVQERIGPDREPVIDEKMKYALKQQWRSASWYIENSLHQENQRMAFETIEGLIDSLDYAFVRGGAIQNAPNRSDYKGLLHELVWMLDGYMMVGADSQLKGVGIRPAMEFEDRPELGYPALRRGFDYTVGAPRITSRSIQLKTGINRKGEYHPGIEMREEVNFMDINPRRLAVKLSRYKDIIHSQFTAPETSSILDKYALGTVQEEIAIVREALANRQRRKAGVALKNTMKPLTDRESEARRQANQIARMEYNKSLRNRKKRRK